MKKIFLISPVRRPTWNLIKRIRYNKEQKKIEKYVKYLEAQGHQVHWPIRDTNQNDPVGLRICTDNGRAIYWADEVHIWWVGSSGSLFDFGMTFMLVLLVAKKVILANPDEVKPTDGKSFENVLLDLHKQNTKGEQR